MVRPILEYGNVVWYPNKKKCIDLIESVQRYYTKCIIGMKGKSYRERLYLLGLPSLVYRRLREDLIKTYKITHKIYDTNITNSLINLSYTNTRAHKFKLLKPRVNRSKFLLFYLQDY